VIEEEIVNANNRQQAYEEENCFFVSGITRGCQ
jgi:hypothetical protein